MLFIKFSMYASDYNNVPFSSPILSLWRVAVSLTTNQARMGIIPSGTNAKKTKDAQDSSRHTPLESL